MGGGCERAEGDTEKTGVHVLMRWLTVLGRGIMNRVTLGLSLPASCRHAALSRPEELSYEVISIQATQVCEGPHGLWTYPPQHYPPWKTFALQAWRWLSG